MRVLAAPAAFVACCGLFGTVASGCGQDEGAATEPIEPAATETAAQLYFTVGEQMRRTPASASSPQQAARDLLDGPAAANGGRVGTEIPTGTRLESLELDDGTATVKVSERFTDGIPVKPGGRTADEEAELDARLAQVTFTLTGFDEVERTRLVAGGVPVGGVRSRDDFARPEAKAPSHRLGDPAPRGRASGSVRSLQERLARLRYLPKGAVDGIDGYRTRQAVTAFQAWEGLQRDGIAGPQTTAALQTAKRPKPKGGGPRRRMEVYRDKGVTLLVKKGRTKRAIHTSSGAPGYTTPSGTFEVFRKEVNSWSVPYQVWLPFASYFNAGIAFHAYPDVPPYPASHGCIRVPEPEAEHVYAFARIGTTVIVR